jgi:polyisoprenoid-binding protein YceI
VNKRSIPIPVLLLVLALAGAARAQVRPIDVQRSTMTVHVYKAGLFSFAAHDHEIRAPLAEGQVDDSRAVSLRVDVKQLQVMDQDISAKDRAEIQENMLGPEVLDSQQFPEIRFRSVKVEEASQGQWTVHGDLTLHGQTHPIVLKATGDAGHYRGSVVLKQKDFGMKPYSAAGGTVKVKNEVEIVFEIFTAPQAAAAPAASRADASASAAATER